MKKTNFFYKIRYAETDQMGIVHHSNYLLYLEQARIDWLEERGISYSKLEDDGIMMPVHDLQISYKKPLEFGDTVKVVVKCIGNPSVKIKFEYTLYNSFDLLVATANVVLVVISARTRKPIRCPKNIYKILAS